MKNDKDRKKESEKKSKEKEKKQKVTQGKQTTIVNCSVMLLTVLCFYMSKVLLNRDRANKCERNPLSKRLFS
jgi:hypothetical protein